MLKLLVACVLLATLPQPPAKVAPSEISRLGFLTGSWRSADEESIVEEIWSSPEGDNMVGCFRWLSGEGEAQMFEILTIVQEGDAVRLRLRHFSPSLAAKEEKDKPMTLKLGKSTATRAEFEAEKDAGDLERVVYEVKDGTLAIGIIFKKTDKPREPLEFRLKKVGK